MTKRTEMKESKRTEQTPPRAASLRENSSYDVLCWATDAIGNDIMQSMVVLPLPWADTRASESEMKWRLYGQMKRLVRSTTSRQLQNASRLEAIASRLEAIITNKKLLGTSASLLVTSALLLVTRSY